MTRATTARKSVSRKTGRSAPKKRRSPDELMALILNAATEAFEERGFSNTTTAAIARKAGVTEAQLFRYFPSKAELFRAAVFEPLNQHLLRFLPAQISDLKDAQSIDAKSRLYITELQHFLSEHSDLWMSLLVAERYRHAGVDGVAQVDSLQTYFERGAATTKSRLKGAPRVAPELMVRVSFASVLGCILFKDWIFPAGTASDKSIHDAINDFVMDGLNGNESAVNKPARARSGRRKRGLHAQKT